METKGKLTISMDSVVLSDCKVRAAKVEKSISQYIEDLIVQDIKKEPVIEYQIFKTKKLKRKGAAGNGSSEHEQT